MANYLIEMPHTPEECMQALDQIVEENPDLLQNIWWGCKQGNHTGWTVVEAGSESEACSVVPEAERDNACIAEVEKLTLEQIKSFHEMAA